MQRTHNLHYDYLRNSPPAATISPWKNDYVRRSLLCYAIRITTASRSPPSLAHDPHTSPRYQALSLRLSQHDRPRDRRV